MQKHYTASTYFMISNNVNKFAVIQLSLGVLNKVHLSYTLHRAGLKLRLDCKRIEVISLKRPLTCCSLANKLTGQRQMDRI